MPKKFKIQIDVSLTEICLRPTTFLKVTFHTCVATTDTFFAVYLFKLIDHIFQHFLHLRLRERHNKLKILIVVLVLCDFFLSQEAPVKSFPSGKVTVYFLNSFIPILYVLRTIHKPKIYILS